MRLMNNRFFPFLCLYIILVLFFLLGCRDSNSQKNEDKNNNQEEVLIKKKLVLNPFRRAPLAARLTFKTNFETGVSIKVLGKPNEIEIKKDFPEPKSNHIIPIVGLFANRLNKIEISLIDSNGKSTYQEILEIQTKKVYKSKPLRVEIGDLNVKTNNKEKAEAGFIYTKNAVYRDNYVWDANGQLRAHYISAGRSFVRLRNGNFITFDAIKKVFELDILGQTVNSFELPKGFKHVHHDAYEMPNGNLLLTVDSETATVKIDREGEIPSVEDFIIEIDGKTGELINQWDLRQILDVDRNRSLIKGSPWDWFHANATVFDDKDSSIIVSGAKQGLIKVGYHDKELKWVMAPHINWGKAGAKGELSFQPKDKLLTAVDKSGTPYGALIQQGIELPNDNQDPFHWCYGNHSPLIVPTPPDSLLHILVFNNRANRIYQPKGKGKGELMDNKNPYSLMVEYVVDEKKQTIKQLKSYNHGKYSYARSGVHIGEKTGNYMMMGEGLTTLVSEYTKAGELVFQADIQASKKHTGFHRMVKHHSIY